MSTPPLAIVQLSRLQLTCANASQLAEFYERAFDARRLGFKRFPDEAFSQLMNIEGAATCISLLLGNELIELFQFDQPGDPYPAQARSSDLSFQHFAIVVNDMDRAYRRLSALSGWSPISTQGPELLPPTSGGVTAFKFRDPEGHPLELLAFPKGPKRDAWNIRSRAPLFLGIDHSAISVSDSLRSIAFYENLGFEVSANSFNRGPSQDRLDGLAQSYVEVTALTPRHGTPHLELLCYEPGTPRKQIILRNNDVAATRLGFDAESAPPADGPFTALRCIPDPDGHRIVISALRAGDTCNGQSSNAGTSDRFSPARTQQEQRGDGTL